MAINIPKHADNIDTLLLNMIGGTAAMTKLNSDTTSNDPVRKTPHSRHV